MELNLHEKSIGSPFVKLNTREIFFFLFFKISKTYIFTFGSLSIKNVHVKNNLQSITRWPATPENPENPEKPLKWLILLKRSLKYPENWEVP